MIKEQMRARIYVASCRSQVILRARILDRLNFPQVLSLGECSLYRKAPNLS